MCGRVGQSRYFDENRETQIEWWRGWKRLWNVKPTHTAAILLERAGHRVVDLARRAVIPPSAGDDFSSKYSTFDVRRNKLTDGRMWPRLFRRQRCVVPVDSTYEWTGPKKNRIPHWVHAPDGKLLRLAGLWEHPRYTGAPPTFTVVTCDPGPFMAKLYDREAVTLDDAGVRAWLDPTTPAEQLPELGVPTPEGRLREHVVAVLPPFGDRPELIVPAGSTAKAEPAVSVQDDLFGARKAG